MKIIRCFLPCLLWLLCSVAHAGYAEREPACQAGQVLDGGLCYDQCKSGETGVGPICWGSCPSGTKDIGAVCSGTDIRFKATYDRGVGTLPYSCPAGQENNAGLCYPVCKAGFYGNGPVCWEATPSGWIDAGLWFWRWNWGIQTRGKASYGRGAGTTPKACPPGQENQAGLCYTPCKSGFSGMATLCIAQCPAGYVNDGLSCRKETTVAKPSRGRGVGTSPPANDGYCHYAMPLTTKNGQDRLYSQTAWVGTHNAYANVKDGYSYAMQTFDVQRQLEGGVRVINLDIHLYNNEIVMCHENCNGSPTVNYGTERKKLLDTLRVIKSFLDKNPTEIVTLVFESYVRNSAKLEAAFKEAGLSSLAFIPKDAGISQMPTLKKMIADNKRLVVLSQDAADASTTSVTKAESNYFVENLYGFDFSLDNYAVTARNLPLDSADRGFMLNHFGTATTSLNATRNNSVGILGQRVFVTARKAANGRLPTILLVDFYQVPFCEAFKTVKDINDSF